MRPTSPRWSISPRPASSWPTAPSAATRPASRGRDRSTTDGRRRDPAGRGRSRRSPNCSIWHFEREDFEVAHTADGEEALLLARESRARSRPARLDDRGPVRDRGLPPPAPHARNRQRADHHADRARRGGGPHPRLETGADDYVTKPFSPARAGRARRRGAAPRAPGAGRRAAELCRYRDGHGRPQGKRGGARSRSARPNSACCSHFLEHPGRVFSRERLLDCGLGPGQRYRAAHRRRPHPPAAQGDQRRRQAPTSSAPCARPAMRSTPTATLRADGNNSPASRLAAVDRGATCRGRADRARPRHGA